VIPARPLASAAIAAAIALVSPWPFVADRLVTPRLPPLASSLVFPLALAINGFVASRCSLYGTSGCVVQSRVGKLALIQLVAITGVPGVAFLVGWFASVGASVAPAAPPRFAPVRRAFVARPLHAASAGLTVAHRLEPDASRHAAAPCPKRPNSRNPMKRSSRP